MVKLAERIKADFIQEFCTFAEEMEKAVENRVRDCGRCKVSLGDRFEVKWDNLSMSYIRIPTRLASIVENEYCFHGFKIEHHYTPMGRLHAFTIKI